MSGPLLNPEKTTPLARMKDCWNTTQIFAIYNPALYRAYINCRSDVQPSDTKARGIRERNALSRAFRITSGNYLTSAVG